MQVRVTIKDEFDSHLNDVVNYFQWYWLLLKLIETILNWSHFWHKNANANETLVVSVNIELENWASRWFFLYQMAIDNLMCWVFILYLIVLMRNTLSTAMPSTISRATPWSATRAPWWSTPWRTIWRVWTATAWWFGRIWTRSANEYNKTHIGIS